MVNDQGERCRKASASLPLLYQWKKKITTFAAAATFQANYCLDLQKFILTLILPACVMINVYGLIQPSACRNRVKCYSKALRCMVFWTRKNLCSSNFLQLLSIDRLRARSFKTCSLRFSLYKLVYFKCFWTQLKTVHLQGLSGLTLILMYRPWAESAHI